MESNRDALVLGAAYAVVRSTIPARHGVSQSQPGRSPDSWSRAYWLVRKKLLGAPSQGCSRIWLPAQIRWGHALLWDRPLR